MRTLATTLCLTAGVASAQSASHIMVTTPQGTSLHTTTSPLSSAGPATPGFQEDPLWSFTDSDSIPNSVSVTDSGAGVWVGHSLNDERVSRFSVAGGNVPTIIGSVLGDNPDNFGIAASSDSTRCVAISQPSSGPIIVRGYSTAGGSTPDWTYTFDAQYTTVDKQSVVVSADGSRAAVCAYNGSDILLVVLDGSGNVINSTTVAGFSLRLDMDDSGNRVLVTAGATARLFDTTTLAEEFALAVSGAGGHARISADGSAIAAGGFNYRAAQEINGNWQIVYTGSGSQEWFGGVSLSGDGNTLFALSHNYADGFLTNTHRVVDLTTASIVSNSSYTGTGGNQNSAVTSESNSDGTMFVAASWGDVGNTMPEVRVYDRDLNLIDSIDTVGSPFDIDLSSDGTTLAVVTKAIHANDNGRGGYTYLHQLPTSNCLADVNGDGMLTAADFTAWINAFNNTLPECDQNGDGSCTATDFTAWIANFNAGC